MKFSILVPVYNVEQYLEECIQSILNQTFQDFELILVDDGSKDESGLICDKFAKEYPDRIKVVHKENQGLISARRVGIANATGEFCIFVDSDDYVEKNLLAVVKEYTSKEPEIDILLYSFAYCNNQQKLNQFHKIAEDSQVWTGESKKELYEKISCTSDITSIWTKAIRTSILKEDPTDYSLYYDKNMAEDLLQSLYPLTVARKVMYTEQALYNYRINEKSISRSYGEETLLKKNTVHVYEQVLEYLERWNMNSKNIRDRVDAKWFNEAMYMILKSYEAAITKAEKNAILQMDWDSLIPHRTYYAENIYENKDYQKLYVMWKEKKHRKIKEYFFARRFYRKVKKIKNKWRKH